MVRTVEAVHARGITKRFETTLALDADGNQVVTPLYTIYGCFSTP